MARRIVWTQRANIIITKLLEYFKIYYQIEPDSLVIILIWDCRQNPATINLKSNL